MPQTCPRCSGVAHRSRTRSWLERMRRRVTGRVPYRCRRCNWRGWLEHTSEGQVERDDSRRALTDDELEELEPGETVKGDEP